MCIIYILLSITFIYNYLHFIIKNIYKKKEVIINIYNL